MSTLFRKFEIAMTAAAFAEAGEFDSARQMLKEDESQRNAKTLVRETGTDKVLRPD